MWKRKKHNTLPWHIIIKMRTEMGGGGAGSGEWIYEWTDVSASGKELLWGISNNNNNVSCTHEWIEKAPEKSIQDSFEIINGAFHRAFCQNPQLYSTKIIILILLWKSTDCLKGDCFSFKWFFYKFQKLGLFVSATKNVKSLTGAFMMILANLLL